MQKETITIVKMTADEGKVFMRKYDNLILSNSLYLGIGDSTDNYTEVDAHPESGTDESDTDESITSAT